MTYKYKINYYLTNGVLSIAGYVINKAITFFTIPIFTRMLSPSDYGIINTYTAWLSILSYILGLALEYSVRTAYIDYKEQYEKYISTICGLSLSSFFLIGIIIFILNKVFFHQGTDLICILCIMHAYVHALINYVNIKFTMLEQIGKKVAMLLFPNVISVFISMIIIYNMNEERYMGRIWGYIVVFIPIGLFVLILQFHKNRNIYDKEMWRYAIGISIPMIFHGLSTVILSSSDRIIINHFLGTVQTGIYSLVYNLIMVVVAIMNAIENVWIPWYTKQMQVRNFFIINKMGRSYIFCILILVTELLFFSPEIIILMSTKEYLSGKYLIVPLLISSFVIFLYSLSICTEIYYKNTKQIAINTIIAAVLNVFLDWFLIPIYGISAAAYATLFSYIILMCMHYAYAYKLNNMLFPIRMYFIPCVVIIITGAFVACNMERVILRWGIGGIEAIVSLIIFSYFYKNHENIAFK